MLICFSISETQAQREQNKEQICLCRVEGRGRQESRTQISICRFAGLVKGSDGVEQLKDCEVCWCFGGIGKIQIREIK